MLDAYWRGWAPSATKGPRVGCYWERGVSERFAEASVEAATLTRLDAFSHWISHGPTP
jgi:hypothetical protein